MVPRDVAAQVAIWAAVLSVCVLWPDAVNRWVLPKEVVLLAAALVASFAVARGRLPRWFWIVVGIGAGVLAVSALVGDNPLAALFGRYPRYEGLISLPVYLAAAWLGARMLGSTAPAASRRALVLAAATASTLIALVGLLETAGLRPIATDLVRPGSLLGNATDQGIVGAVLAVLLLPPLAVARARRDRVVAVAAGIGALAGAASVAFSASRAGVLALAAGLVVVTVTGLLLTRGSDRRRLAIAAGLAASVAAVLVLLVPYTRERLLGIDTLATQTVGDRVYIWAETLDLLAAHPVLGVGPSGFLGAFMQGRDADWYTHITAGGTLDSPHNVVLQIAAAGGIAGLACAVALLVFAVRAGVRVIRATRRPELIGAAGALVGLAAALLTHFTTPALGILGALLLGMLIAAAPRPALRWERPVGAGLIGVWLVVLVVALWGDTQLRAGLGAASAQESDAAFARAVVARPWDVDARSMAAQTLTARADAGDPAALEPALRANANALAVLPDDRAVLLAAGVAARRAGDIPGAQSLFAHAAALYPSDPLVLAQYGATRVMAGDPSGLADLERAGAIAPDDETVGVLLEWARSVAG